ncbi:MAG: nitrous-oxide reductase [Nitrosopumilales archaeon]|nr:MAG: nitrous-oxide reductase [Nitrosopumilales archaeon]
MNDTTKITIIACISIAAIIIAVIAITIPMKNIQENEQTAYTDVKREYWLFNSDVPEFNETKTGMPHDAFSMPVISALKGDTIVIHFFNTEEPSGDHHSFTILDKPYNINVELSPEENKTITFVATTAGVFTYYCTFHQPTMRGQLIVELPNS